MVADTQEEDQEDTAEGAEITIESTKEGTNKEEGIINVPSPLTTDHSSLRGHLLNG